MKKNVQIQNNKLPEYAAVHSWLKNHYGRAFKCENENCKSVNPKRFEWALIKGLEYKKDRNNFIMMCPSCHRKYDETDNSKANRSKAHKGNQSFLKKKIVQYDLNWNFIKEFESISEAAKFVNGTPCAFTFIKNGSLKTYKGFKWKYA